MNWTAWMQRSLDLWFTVSILFLIFVTATVWRALAQIRSLRRRLENLQGRIQPPPHHRVVEAEAFAEAEAEAEAVSGDWVPRR